MNDIPTHKRLSPLGWGLLGIVGLLAMPLVLIGIVLIDQEIIRSGVPRSLYKALGIWDPLSDFYRWLEELG